MTMTYDLTIQSIFNIIITPTRLNTNHNNTIFLQVVFTKTRSTTSLVRVHGEKVAHRTENDIKSVKSICLTMAIQ